LFSAACSELGTEVHNNRRTADEHMRQQRTLLQHEIDILQQTLGHELLTLNDNVRGMFNDRKMAVSQEQKAADSSVCLLSCHVFLPTASGYTRSEAANANRSPQIQQISYKLSIDLSSDAKSEIEGLRWVLIRRSVIGILFMVVVTLGTLRYATYISHEAKREAEQHARDEEARRRADGKIDHSAAPDAAEILAAN
jgi:hypothetical protein